jgi:hypothetical protein
MAYDRLTEGVRRGVSVCVIPAVTKLCVSSLRLLLAGRGNPGEAETVIIVVNDVGLSAEDA